MFFQLHASLASCVPPLLLSNNFSTGISTCCPSATPLGLTLGPDLPWADEPAPGNLSLSASFGTMLSPGTFSAQRHSTSELLRTL